MYMVVLPPVKVLREITQQPKGSQANYKHWSTPIQSVPWRPIGALVCMIVEPGKKHKKEKNDLINSSQFTSILLVVRRALAVSLSAIEMGEFKD